MDKISEYGGGSPLSSSDSSYTDRDETIYDFGNREQIPSSQDYHQTIKPSIGGLSNSPQPAKSAATNLEDQNVVDQDFKDQDLKDQDLNDQDLRDQDMQSPEKKPIDPEH